LEAPVLLLLFPEPPPPPLPPPEELLLLAPVLDEPVVLDRVVPLCEVFALDDVLVVVLVFVSTEDCAVELVERSAEVDETFAVAVVVPELLDDSADVDADPDPDPDPDPDDTPLVALGVSSPLVAAELPAPAPDDDPAVFEACAATVPVVDACTYISFSLFGFDWNCGSASRITWYWFSCVYSVLIWR
jgi:hypothetical protein